MTHEITLAQAMALADQDCPLPVLAGRALRCMRDRIRELEAVGKVVVTRDEAGMIVAVTRQDADGEILSVIAESAAQPPVVDEAMVDRYLAAQKETICRLDRQWGTHAGGSDHVRDACKAGLTAALRGSGVQMQQASVPDSSECGCEDCGAPYGKDGWCDVVIPDEHWNAIAEPEAILCFRCMTKRLQTAGKENIPVIVASGPYADANEEWRLIGFDHGHKVALEESAEQQASVPDDAEEVSTSLGDDAAAMLDGNPEDERALNMQRAAAIIDAMLAASPKPRTCTTSCMNCSERNTCRKRQS